MLRSAAALLFAIAFFWPTLGERGLIDLFAAYVFVDAALTLSPGGWDFRARAVWPLLAVGCCDLAAAAAAYAWPGMTLPGFAVLVGLWSVALAASFAIAGASLRAADPGHLLLLSGIAAGLFGRALLSHTGADAVVLSTWIGLYALTSGILLFRLVLRRYRPVAFDVPAP